MDFNNIKFNKGKHVKFFKRFLNLMPPSLSNMDSTRVTVLFFALSGLDLLNSLDELNDDFKRSVCDWLYRLQVLPEDCNMMYCGFEGSDTFHIKQDDCVIHCNEKFANGHLAMTYTALATLLILGDDLSRINKEAILRGVGALQQEDGNFCATQLDSECDMRFIYCACCICYMLKDWSFIDTEKTVNYIKSSMSHDYGFGLGPDLESHGGLTYCAVASLVLMDKLHYALTKKQIDGLRTWAIMRQVSGFQGRANKPEDTCYSFWMLDFFDKVDFKLNRYYVMTTQDSVIGGFAKWIDSTPDPLHTYLGIGGLSFMGEEGLLENHAALNFSTRAVSYLHKLHKSWAL